MLFQQKKSLFINEFKSGRLLGPVLFVAPVSRSAKGAFLDPKPDWVDEFHKEIKLAPKELNSSVVERLLFRYPNHPEIFYDTFKIYNFLEFEQQFFTVDIANMNVQRG